MLINAPEGRLVRSVGGEVAGEENKDVKCMLKHMEDWGKLV